MPWGAVLAVCMLLVGGAAVMASQSIALAADGAFQLVRVLGTEDVYGLDARILGAWAHQGAVVVAVRAGVTDTQLLAVLLGVGQLVLPAIAWSLAIVESRADRLVCAAVAMIAVLNAGGAWFVNVSEIVLAVSLTSLVAVLLWRPSAWRWRDVALASTASIVLVASYETALLTGAVLAVWAAWRLARSQAGVERFGCAIVAALGLLSLVVAVAGTRSGANPTHSQSFLYYVVSFEPWPFYVGLAGAAAVIAACGLRIGSAARHVTLGLGCGLLIVALAGFEPSVVSAFQARGGAAVSALLLELFLWWRWISPTSGGRQTSAALTVVPLAFAIAMVAVNVEPVTRWSRSLDAFRAAVLETEGQADVSDALPRDERAVVWGWTASSLSLLLRSDPNDGILVDGNPSYVPFPPSQAREQLSDEYRWNR